MRPRHSVLGSAIGFGFMGSGIGFFVGCVWMVLVDRWGFPVGFHIQGKAVWYILRAIPVCAFLGAVAGVRFASWANRRRSTVDHFQNKMDGVE